MTIDELACFLGLPRIKTLDEQHDGYSVFYWGNFQTHTAQLIWDSMLLRIVFLADEPWDGDQLIAIGQFCSEHNVQLELHEHMQ